MKLQIYISNRIHTIRNYTYVHPYCMHVRRTAYIYIEVTHLYIEPNTYTSKLHIYTSNQIHIHRNYTYINGTIHINRNAFVHIEIIRLYFELFTCVRRACLYEVLNRENCYINRNFGKPVSGYTGGNSRRGPWRRPWRTMRKDASKKPA